MIAVDAESLVLTIPNLKAAYEAGLTPRQLVAEVKRRIALAADNPIWIHCLTDEELAPYLDSLERVDVMARESLPLYGIPFAIKDNIDVAGISTTAACAEFAYTPGKSAFVIEQLVAAGAIPIGKTNMDQFATGLVGTRSPWGAVRNAFDENMISGGSSSGSAVAVALGQVAFSLGTDTAGSGRIPAAFNNLVGYKPSRGLVSTVGVVPACRTLDCVSIFSLTLEDAEMAGRVARTYDESDAYARPHKPAKSVPPMPVVGVPRAQDLAFFGDSEYAELFDAFVAGIPSAACLVKEVDISPLLAAAKLLYEGAWVAERYHAAQEIIESSPEVLREEFLAIVQPAKDLSAVEYFDGAYRLAEFRRQAEDLLAEVDVLAMPTAGSHFSMAEVAADPIKRNTALGYYTNFMNLLDLCGVAIPAGFTDTGLPFGVTLASDAMTDTLLLQCARRLLALRERPLGALSVSMIEPAFTSELAGTIPVAVCGAHLSGMPLNVQLMERNASLREATRSADCYRLYALPGGPPLRPGMVRVAEGGTKIAVEVYDVPAEHVGSFLAGIPEPLGLGRLELESGEWVTGFICEPCGLEGAEDISDFGGWRGYIAQFGG